MKFSTHVLSFVGACLLAGHASAITVEDDAVLYCVGATTSNRGVYTLPLEGPYPDNPTKISTTAMGGIQWSFMNSGGTFLSKEKAVGTAVMYGTSVYVSIATAEGNGDGAWTHTYYNYSNSYPDTMKATDMVYDPTDDKVYTWCFQGSYYTALGTFDAENKSATMIGAAGFTKIDALTIDADGTLWGINGSQGSIYTIDKATGAMTQKFSLGVSYNGANQSAAYDPASGKIYWGATSMYAAALFAIDLEAQTCEKVYDFPTGARFNGFYIPGPDTKKGAPAAPENLAAVYSGEGNKMNVSFTAPTTTYGGTALSGSLTYTVQVDGTEAATGTIEAGAEFAEQIDMTDGPHTVVAFLSNVVGDGAKASVKTYAGFDQPADVTGLGFVAEGNNVTVTWTAPEGANGGIVDTSKLTYKVTRNPDGVVVADNLTETTVTDVIPEGPIAEYSYTVTVVYDGVEGQSITTAGQLVGEPYTVPYSQNFDDVDSFGEIAFKSLADRNTTVLWQIADNDGNKCARLKYNYMSAVASHLFTAPIQMYKGVTYTLKFKVACSVGGETPQLRVNLSKGQTTTSSEFIYPWIASRIDYASTADNAGQYQELSYEFTVDEDGVYFIDFFDTTTSWVYGDTISIDDIEVTGVFPTPQAVTDLTAAPVETGSRDIKISFTTPLQDIHGNDLSEISKVVIVRGTQTVAELDKVPGTEEPIAPGTAIEYLIENAPRGLQSYSVIAYNGVFPSAAAVTATMAGYLNNLVLQSVEFPEEIKYNGTGKVNVEVFNDGADIALDYRVVLLANGNEADFVYGELIHTDETLPYEFTLEWNRTMPAEVTYSVAVEFYGDENLDDNTSDDYVVKYEPEPVSINDIAAAGVNVTVDGQTLVVKGANGMKVGVYTTDGRCVAATASAAATWSQPLAAGTYVVTVGEASTKVSVL